MWTHQFAFDDLRSQPELLLDLLAQQDKAWVFERKAEHVVVRPFPTYSAETDRLLAEAKALHRQKVAKGYSRKAAFDDLTEALVTISSKAS